MILVSHNSGKGSKYTRSRLPVKLEYVIHGFTRSQALKLEYRLKHEKKESKIQFLKNLI